MRLSKTLYQSTALVRTFGKEEDGAITVDWVVLTAAVVGLGIAVLATVTGGSVALGGKMSGTMDSFDLGGNGGGGADSGGGSSAMTIGDIYEASSRNRLVMSQSMGDYAPDGYSYEGRVDRTTGYPIYQNGNEYSIGGQTMSAQDYENSGRQSVDTSDAWRLYRQGYYDS